MYERKRKAKLAAPGGTKGCCFSRSSRSLSMSAALTPVTLSPFSRHICLSSGTFFCSKKLLSSSRFSSLLSGRHPMFEKRTQKGELRANPNLNFQGKKESNVTWWTPPIAGPKSFDDLLFVLLLQLRHAWYLIDGTNRASRSKARQVCVLGTRAHTQVPIIQHVRHPQLACTQVHPPPPQG